MKNKKHRQLFQATLFTSKDLKGDGRASFGVGNSLFTCQQD